MELWKNQTRLALKNEGKRIQEWSNRLYLLAPGPAARAGRQFPVPAGIPTYLDLVLLPSILYRLEDVPGTSPPHLQAGHVAPVPSLDQDRCLEGCMQHKDTGLLAGTPRDGAGNTLPHAKSGGNSTTQKSQEAASILLLVTQACPPCPSHYTSQFLPRLMVLITSSLLDFHFLMFPPHLGPCLNGDICRYLAGNSNEPILPFVFCFCFSLLSQENSPFHLKKHLPASLWHI